VISIKNLSKTFGTKKVLADINIDIEKGAIVALTGPNGAGKTTLLKILSCLILPSIGTAEINGVNCITNRTSCLKNTGIALNSEYGFYAQLTVKENLQFFCRLYETDCTKIAEMLELLSLAEFKNTKFLFCSAGTKQKLTLARALIKNPAVILIDELSKSLDNTSAENIYNILKNINSINNTTILFVTHNINEILNLSTHYFILKEGTIISEGKTDAVKNNPGFFNP